MINVLRNYWSTQLNEFAKAVFLLALAGEGSCLLNPYTLYLRRFARLDASSSNPQENLAKFKQTKPLLDMKAGLQFAE